MKPGPDLNAKVAIELMGWKKSKHTYYGIGWTDPDGGFHRDPPKFSTDIAAAMKVSEKFFSEVKIIYKRPHGVDFRGLRGGDFFYTHYAIDVAHGICLTALEANEASVL